MSDILDPQGTDASTTTTTTTKPTGNRMAKFQVGLSSDESLDSFNNFRDEEDNKYSYGRTLQSQENATATANANATTKRRAVTHRKKRHKNERDKFSGV